ncbi:MAG: ABC transporter permease subunit [Planctomycetes bacterium]|nr:ABC transporter permease subunit [Planctomycetota bacterium]
MAVFDQGYQRWQGEFRPQRLRWLPMVRYQVALTLKRKLIWLILFLAIVPSIGFSGVLYFATETSERIVTPGMVDPGFLLGEEERSNPLVDQTILELGGWDRADELMGMTRDEKYWLASCLGFYFFLLVPQSFVVLLVTSAVGAGLIAQDIRSNALEIYLTKPITARDYIIGKLAVIVFFIMLATFLPTMLVFGTAAATMDGYFGVVWPILPRIFASCLLASLVSGIFMLGLSSLAKSSRYAAVIWFALCLISAITSLVLSAVTEEDAWLFLGFRNNFSYLISEIFGGGLMTGVTGRGAVEVTILLPIGILAGIVLLSLSIMRKTIRSVENR